MTILAYLAVFFAVQIAIPLAVLPFLLVEKSLPKIPALAIGLASLAGGGVVGGLLADGAGVLASLMAAPTTTMLLLPLVTLGFWALRMFSNASSGEGMASCMSAPAACVAYATVVLT